MQCELTKIFNMLNIVYAIDENYNKQAYLSICSILENTSTNCSIFIIHKCKISFEPYKDMINKIFKNVNIKIFNFSNNENFYFPNLEDAHVSDATYYRLFIDQYIPKTVKQFIYIDADAFCLQDPTEVVEATFQQLKEGGYFIGAKTEHTEKDLEFERIKKLGIDSKYFNAGVMFVDYEKSLNFQLFQKLRVKLNEIQTLIEFWDQDVLNSFFNGDFYEINANLNFDSNKLDLKKNIITKKIIFLHFKGSKKPWTIDGIFNTSSIFYTKLYQKYNLGSYHITTRWRKDLLIKFLKSITSFKIFRLKNPIKFSYSVLSVLVKNNE